MRLTPTAGAAAPRAAALEDIGRDTPEPCDEGVSMVWSFGAEAGEICRVSSCSLLIGWRQRDSIGVSCAMRLRLFGLIGFGCAAILTADVRSQSAQGAPASGLLMGRVVEATSGAPIRGALVRLNTGERESE